jgi:hypothetical protein
MWNAKLILKCLELMWNIGVYAFVKTMMLFIFLDVEETRMAAVPMFTLAFVI